MARRLLTTLLAASLLLPLAHLDSTSSPPTATAYDELCLQGFPRGLLQANACAYMLDAGFGDFAVDLCSSCRIVLPAGSYLAAFSDRLTGCLDDHRFLGLDGIHVRAFFCRGPSQASATSFHFVASSSALTSSSSTTTSSICLCSKVTLR
jgi:hypothetical protein